MHDILLRYQRGCYETYLPSSCLKKRGETANRSFKHSVLHDKEHVLQYVNLFSEEFRFDNDYVAIVTIDCVIFTLKIICADNIHTV